ncbi:hypothetical protein BLOT_003586 [Blomia tropicalis]|nr:hypothetical protein BLOT_003586 [Blomia tropicalis]
MFLKQTFRCIFILTLTIIVIDAKRPLTQTSSSLRSSQNWNDNILDKTKSKCTEDGLKRIGIQLTRTIGFGPNGRPFPNTTEGMKPYCKETFKMLDQAESFAKSCFKKDVKHLGSVYLYSVRNTFNRRICGPKNVKKVQPLIQDANNCINRHYYTKGHDCILSFTNHTAQLVTLKDDKIKFPHVCCNNIKLMACLNGVIDSNQCLQPHRDRLLSVITGAASGISDIACGEFTDSSDKCDRLGSPPIPEVPNRKKYHALVLVLIDLVVSMKNFSSNL